MSYKPEDFELYDILVEAECYFAHQEKIFHGYKEGEYWGAILEATKRLREKEAPITAESEPL